MGYGSLLSLKKINLIDLADILKSVLGTNERHDTPV